MYVESSSTIRDFPVPDELTMQVDLEYGANCEERKSEMVLKRAVAALPLYWRLHACTVAVIGDVQETKKKKALILSRTIYSGLGDVQCPSS
jgi:hypothetical protein